MTVAVPPVRHTSTRIRLARRGAAALIGSGLLAVAAHVAIPFWPVPMTLQTLAVFALGAVLGPVAGTAAVLAYLAEGLCGLPVFAHGTGMAALLGPTGGYLVGFAVAAAMIGSAARRGWLARPLTGFATFALADAVIFALGVAWLATLVGLPKAVAAGVIPFLLGEALKVGLATALTQTPPLRRILG